MSSLTIDVLKSALVSKGIFFHTNSKKSEILKLYKEHVAPLHNIKINDSYNQFSSDDEEISFSKQSHTSKSKITTKMATDNSVVDLDVSSLSDDELFNHLSKFGCTTGPIVDSTRRIYQKKLIRLMGGDVVDSSFNGEVDDEEEGYSDTEPGHKVHNGNEVHYTEDNSRTFVPAKPSPPPALRTRVTTTNDWKYEKYSSPSLSEKISFDINRHTPSPRPSLRTVTSSTKYSGNVRETTSIRHSYSSAAEKAAAQDKSDYIRRLIVKCIILFVLILALYFTYHYMYSESPFKGLENLAQQALDSASADGVKKGGKKVPSKS